MKQIEKMKKTYLKHKRLFAQLINNLELEEKFCKRKRDKNSSSKEKRKALG
jgi:hypothetical protein